MSNDFKVVGVISSARFNGNTATLVRETLKGAEEEGATVTEIFLPTYDLKHCIGCSRCLTDGGCPLSDGFMEIRELLYEADGIIWGSPTYGGAPNSIMKTLFDRLGMYSMLTSSFGGKYIAGISTAGSAMTANKVAKGLAACTASGAFERGYISGVLGAGYSRGNTAHEDSMALAKARKLGRKISTDIKEGRRYPMQNLPLRLINRLIVKGKFADYISKERENGTKAVFNNLAQRGYI